LLIPWSWAWRYPEEKEVNSCCLQAILYDILL
jgi:hypothetical protein